MLDLYPQAHEDRLREWIRTAHVPSYETPEGDLGWTLREPREQALAHKREEAARRLPADVHGYLSHWAGFQPGFWDDADTRGDLFEGEGWPETAMASLIWLTVTKGRWADEVTTLRAARDLYVQVGRWMGQRDAGVSFDAALAERMKIDQGIQDEIQDEDLDGLLLGQNIGNAARRLIGWVVQIYLIVVIVWVVWERVGASV